MSEKIFCLRPQYLNEFKCDGVKCDSKCCQNNWGIFVDAKTCEKYFSLPPEQSRKILQHLRPDSTGDKFFIVHDKNRCPFLDADNLCCIQKAYGEDYISRVCASFPRMITRLENFLEVALSPTCPLAAEIILLKREPLTFELVEPDEKFLRLGEGSILQGPPAGFGTILFGIQFEMVMLLQERRLTIDQRLIVLGFFLDRIEELLHAGELDEDSLSKLAEIYSSEKFFVEQVPLMLKCVHFNAAAYENFMRQIFLEVDLSIERTDKKFLPAEFATIAENFLVNEIFLNAWPLRINDSIANNFCSFVTVYKIFERLACCVESVDEVLSMVGEFSKSINHSEDCLLKISALVGDDTFGLMEKLLRA